MATRGEKRLRVFLIPLGMVLLCALLLTCNIDLSVNPIYLDASRNWIADFGLGVARTADASGWAFDYSGATGDAYPYMALTDTGAAVSGTIPEGLDAAARAYRLSIANLMPDPDFALGGTGGWDVGYVVGSGATTSPTMALSASGIHGNCISFNRSYDGQWVRLLLSSDFPGGGGISPIDGSIYQVNFLFLGTSPFVSYSHDPLNDSLQIAVTPSIVTDLRLQTQTFTNSAADYYLYYGPQDIQNNVYVDDIRVVRKAIPLYISLDMRLSDANPTFISGRYVLSVWVKNDPAASYLFSASAAAPYQARALTLEIRALSRTDGGTIGVFRPQDPAAGWSDWSRIDLEFPAGEKLAIDQTDADPVFSLKISPADLSGASGLDAAQILIAQPTLTFHYE
jgi:hypothetical protein